jgi:hypothetical protein
MAIPTSSSLKRENRVDNRKRNTSKKELTTTYVVIPAIDYPKPNQISQIERPVTSLSKPGCQKATKSIVPINMTFKLKAS